MLRDLYFYPLAAALVAAMIALALSFGGGEAISDEDILQAGWTLEGPALRNLSVSPGTTLAYRDTEGGFVTLAAFTPFGTGPGSVGVFATLGPDHERAFAGRTVRVSLRARSAATNGLDAYDAAYFPIESAPSPWEVIPLARDFADHSFTVRLPALASEPNVDLLSVFPGKSGDNRAMDLARIRIEVVDAPDS